LREPSSRLRSKVIHLAWVGSEIIMLLGRDAVQHQINIAVLSEPLVRIKLLHVRTVVHQIVGSHFGL